MNFSAAASSSAVVTPGRIFDSMSLSVLAWIAPAAAIFSISSADFLMITKRPRGRRGARGASQSLLEAQRGERRADVVVDLGRVARAVEAPQQALVLVVVDQRLGVVVVGLQPLRDRLRLVVLALLQPRAVLVADPLALGRVVVDVVGVTGLDAHAATGQAADHLV